MRSESIPRDNPRRVLLSACAAALSLVAGCGGGGDAAAPTSTSLKPEPTAVAGTAEGGETDPYIAFLERNSMLYAAARIADPISGSGTQWRQQYGEPKPKEMRALAPVWMLRYPLSTLPMDGESTVIGTWADPDFWAAADTVGIRLLRTNPVERAGGIERETYTRTIDGFFDRIGLDTAPELGTEEQFRRLADNARRNNATVGSDLVPTHSGLGPDFWLAARNYKDYPGLYSMVEVPQEHWGLLPTVSDPFGREHLTMDNAKRLAELGLIPGTIKVADADPQAGNWPGWNATAAIVGVDGQTRRWVYAHVFKPRQPLYNWLDPSYAARRLNFADLANNVLNRGVRVMRLDANTFLGLEPTAGSQAAQIYLTPLTSIASTDIAMAARKIGGFTYQEFAASLGALKTFAPRGPDMSYDFFTRAESLHGLIDGDALPLRLAHHFMLEAGVQANTLVHDLQNHDEITYQLFELAGRGDFQFEGRSLNGGQLAQRMLEAMRGTVGSRPYNQLYRPARDGIATTYAGFIAPALGVADPYAAAPADVDLIRRGHLLVAHANAMIPGVFAFSEWDAVGALPIPLASVPDELKAGGDVRWVNRGGVDLMGKSSRTATAVFGLPEAKALYGPLPQQLQDPKSFMSVMRAMLAAREKYVLRDAEMLAVPPVEDKGLAVLVMALPDNAGLAITALNYGRAAGRVDVDLSRLPGASGGAQWAGAGAVDAVSGAGAGAVSGAGALRIELEAIQGRTIVVARR